MRFDILIPPTASPKAQHLSQSLFAGGRNAGVDVRLMQAYEPRPGSVLVVYGPGGPDRYPHVKEHVGGLVCWDIGYWERTLPYASRMFRVSIGGFHPKNVMEGMFHGKHRWERAGLTITQAKCKGTIMLVGNGPKSVAVGADRWSLKKSRELKEVFPDRRVSYRPKPNRPNERSVLCDEISRGTIEQALARTSLVVCRHSNVAVDACRMGVPVVCDDGAAAAIYPKLLADYQNQPDALTRLEFLQRLAWWQWTPTEIESGEAWKWLVWQLQ